MHQDVSQRIASLPALNKAQLLVVWRENFSHPPPPKLRKELMVPVLAYRIQEKEFGGLSHQASSKSSEELARTVSTPEAAAECCPGWNPAHTDLEGRDARGPQRAETPVMSIAVSSIRVSPGSRARSPEPSGLVRCSSAPKRNHDTSLSHPLRHLYQKILRGGPRAVLQLP